MCKRAWSGAGVLVVAWALLFGPRPAEAITLGFDPASQDVALGSQATVDVVVDPMTALVGAFDIIVTWDDAILDLASLSVDPANDFGGSFDAVDTLGRTDAVNVALVSSHFDLTPFQNGVDLITLFTLTFDTLALGTSSLAFSPGIQGTVFPFGVGFLGDELGDLLPTPANDGSITVVDRVVPAPATLLLTAIGLIGFAARWRTPRISRD